MKSLKINSDHLEQMIKHLEEVFPQEGCGLAAGKSSHVERIYPVKNSLASSTAFEMDPLEQIEAMLDMDSRQLEFLAIFHSHPFGPAEPSHTDISMAYYPEAAHIIVSWDAGHHRSIRLFSIINGVVDEMELELGG